MKEGGSIKIKGGIKASKADKAIRVNRARDDRAGGYKTNGDRMGGKKTGGKKTGGDIAKSRRTDIFVLAGILGYVFASFYFNDYCCLFLA